MGESQRKMTGLPGRRGAAASTGNGRARSRRIAQRDLGIDEGTLGNWVGAEPPGRRRRLSEDEPAELARLPEGDAELAMERDVLKRSVALSGRRTRWAAGSRGRVHRFPEIPAGVPQAV